MRACTVLLQALEKQLQQVDLELEENAGRVTVMDEHLKNVQQEITYAQHRVSTADHAAAMVGSGRACKQYILQSWLQLIRASRHLN